MASRIYTTESIVLSRSLVGEANLSVALFTREFGRVVARAQGARAGRSKLRFGLEPLSLLSVSLVRGVAGWRIVGAAPYGSLLASRPPASAMGNIATLALRLLPPHEPHAPLYDMLRDDLRFLGRTEDEELLRSAECITVLHVLAELGYLQREGRVAPLARRGALDETLAAEMKPLRLQAVALINASLAASGL